METYLITRETRPGQSFSRKPKKIKNLKIRLMDKIGMPKYSGDGCWTWKAGKDKDGYGRITVILTNGKKVTRRAHRVAYTLFKGPFNKDLCVLHSCDNPQCCNPNHLSLGTKADNSRQMIERGRSQHKFSREHILKVLELLKEGLTQKEVAKRTGISASYVSYIWLNGQPS